MISQTKTLKIKYFLPFNFVIIKLCVAIRLAEDGTRMGGILFRLSPSKIITPLIQGRTLMYINQTNIYEKTCESNVHYKMGN